MVLQPPGCGRVGHRHNTRTEAAGDLESPAASFIPVSIRPSLVALSARQGLAVHTVSAVHHMKNRT